MKILYGVDRLEYSQGIARVVINMAEYLYKEGMDVKIVCGKCNYETMVPVIQCRWNNFLKQSSIVDVLKVIKQEKPDVFHSHYYPMDLCGLLVNSKEIRHVMHAHGVAFLSLRLHAKGLLGYLRANIGECAGAWGAKTIIAISRFVQDELITRYRVPRDKIEIISNSIDLKRFNPEINGDEIRKKYGIRSEDILLLSVSSLNPIKGHELLIDCFSRLLSKKVKNVKLLLVGLDEAKNPQYTKNLLEKIHPNNLGKSIISTGFVNDAELQKYYAACDIFVCTSKWESFCLPLAEAMAAGKPVIGFDRTAIPELILKGYNGYKVKYPNVNEMATKIIQLANDAEGRKTMGMNGRKLAEENFNPKTNMEKIVEIYSQLLYDDKNIFK
jgi:spore coat protein SA